MFEVHISKTFSTQNHGRLSAVLWCVVCVHEGVVLCGVLRGVCCCCVLLCVVVLLCCCVLLLLNGYIIPKE